MTESEVDMDELEARLYGQVYHMSNASDDLITLDKTGINIHTNTFPRYFEQGPCRQIPSSLYDRMALYTIAQPTPIGNNIVMLPPSSTPVFAAPQQNSQKWLEKVLVRINDTPPSKNRRRKAKQRLKLSQKIKEVPVQQELKDKKKEDSVVKEDSMLIVDDEADDVILVENPTEVICIDIDESECVEDVVELKNAKKDGFSPSKNSDKGEVPSSNSSTVDYTENFHGNKDLNEFNLGKNNCFSSLNLDSFTNYMESNGKTCNAISSICKPLMKKKHREKFIVNNSSDSSSESEYGHEEIYVTDTSRDVNVIGDSRDDEQVKVITPEEISNFEKDKVVPEITKANDDDDLSVIEIPSETPQKQDLIFIDDASSVSSFELFPNEADLDVLNSPKMLNVEDAPTISPKTKPKAFMDYYSDDRKKFYTKSWGQEDFSVQEQQKQMSDNPMMWKVIPRDKVNLNFEGKQPRCRRCHEFGHFANKCNKLLPPPKCILCGATGHLETRCPNKMCTSCGRSSDYYTTYCSSCARMKTVMCSICNMNGHLHNNCPDLWRRYLFTTTEGEIVPPPTEAGLKRPEDQWCSGCGCNGHWEQNCGYYNRTHLPTSVRIYNCSDVYSEHNSNQNFHSNTESAPFNVNSVNILFDRSYWELTDNERQTLVQEGSNFLITLENLLSVKVQIQNSKCYLTGPKSSRDKARIAVQRFCSNISGGKVHFSNTCDSESIQKNLEYLNRISVNWKLSGKSIYLSILNNSQGRLRLYKQLNAIVKGKLLIGDARQHMRILENYLYEDPEVVKKSFANIFNDPCRMYPDYFLVINKLPTNDRFIKRPEAVSIEALKKTALKRSDHFESNHINELYNIVIINDYSAETVAMFKREARKISKRFAKIRRFKLHQ